MIPDQKIQAQHVGLAKDPVIACSPSDSLDSEACALQTLPQGLPRGTGPHPWSDVEQRALAGLKAHCPYTCAFQKQPRRVQPMMWTGLPDLPRTFSPSPSIASIPGTFLGQGSGTKCPLSMQPPQTLGSCSRQSSACLFPQHPTTEQFSQAGTPHDDFVLTPYSWVQAVKPRDSLMASARSPQQQFTMPTFLREPPSWSSLSLSPVVSLPRCGSLELAERSGSSHTTPILRDIPERLLQRKRKFTEFNDTEVCQESAKFSFFQQQTSQPFNVRGTSNLELSLETTLSRPRAYLPQTSSGPPWYRCSSNVVFQSPVTALQKSGLKAPLLLGHQNSSLYRIPTKPAFASTPTLGFKGFKRARMSASLHQHSSTRDPAQVSRSSGYTLDPAHLSSLPKLSMGQDKSLERGFMEATCSSDHMLAWGLIMKLSPASVSVARKLCTRVKFEVKPKRLGSTDLDWNEVVTIVGCLWIGSKLCERRQGLFTLSQLGVMISDRTQFQIPNHVFISFEIGIMQKVNWQPLLGCL